MAVDVRLQATTSGEGYLEENSFRQGDKKVLVSTKEAMTHGVFKASTRTTNGTTTVTSPDTGGAIILTDLIITSDKTANSSVIVRFTDGSNTIDVTVGDSVNAPVNIALAFGGCWRGWKDARLEMVTTGAVTATVAVGYMKISNGLPFAEWDALR